MAMANQDQLAALKKGMMIKRAQGKSSVGRLNWKDRFFVLTNTELQYWDRLGGANNPDATKKGWIDLTSVRAVEEVDESAFRRPHVMQTVYEQGVLYTQAADKSERDDWLKMLRQQVAENPGMHQKYHPGMYEGKWTCCNEASKSNEGCKAAYQYSLLGRSSSESALPTPSTNGVPNGSISRGTRANSVPLPPIPYGESAQPQQQQQQQQQQYQPPQQQQQQQAAPPAEVFQAPSVAAFNPPTPQSTQPPLPPLPTQQQPIGQMFEVVAMFQHVATEPSDLSINVGDRLFVLDCTEQHWWKARNAHGQTGFVPRNYVRRLGIEAEPWYRGKISRPEAAALLRMASQEGCFLVRDSESKSGEYSLSVSHGEGLRHYHIKYQDGMYFIHERHRFPDITQLIEYHKLNSGGLVTRLRKSVSDMNAPVSCGLGHEKYEIDPSDITFGRELGSGQFGVVREGQFRNGTKVAIKMMKEGAMSEEDFIAEAKIMKNLSHPNLVQLYGICTKQRPIFIVSELMTLGCLLDYIRNNQNLGTKPEIIHYMTIQVSKAMVFLEQHGFIHRDLAARNCLITDNYVVKVADFGLARFVLDDEYTASQGTKFPIKWAAPEVIQYARFSTKSDVWSFGILMWELWTLGHVPYPLLSNVEVIDKVVEGYRLHRPPLASHQIHQLMLDCWHQEPEYRPTFMEVERRLEENKGEYDENP